MQHIHHQEVFYRKKNQKIIHDLRAFYTHDPRLSSTFTETSFNVLKLELLQIPFIPTLLCPSLQFSFQQLNNFLYLVFLYRMKSSHHTNSCVTWYQKSISALLSCSVTTTSFTHTVLDAKYTFRRQRATKVVVIIIE